VLVGKIEYTKGIQGSVTLPCISIRYFSHPSKALTEEGLSLLLSSFGAIVTRDDVLVPCFDMEEMMLRNAAKARSNTQCS
jgi:hypothetical protein